VCLQEMIRASRNETVTLTWPSISSLMANASDDQGQGPSLNAHQTAERRKKNEDVIE
jgi:hypothetical protein